MQEAGGARLVGARHVPVLVRARVDDDVLARIALVDLAGRVDPVADRHADVHQNDVGGELLDQPHRLVAVPPRARRR